MQRCFVFDWVIVSVDDSRLIERTLAGDHGAYGALVLKYQDRLYGTLCHLLGSPHDAQDVAQDAFLNAYLKLKTFRQQASFYSWLFRIAYHVAVSSRRKNRRHQLASVDDQRIELGIEPLDRHVESDPAQPLQSREDQQQIQNALQQLAPEFREPLLLKEFEEMKYEEIAELMQIPVGTVRSRIHRARTELRALLDRQAANSSTPAD